MIKPPPARTPCRDGSACRTGARLAIALTLIVFAAGLLLALIVEPRLMGDPELRGIERTRAANLARAQLSIPLPGTPDLTDLTARLAANGVALGAPVLIRIFKREFELELWLARDGRFHRFATYPVCRWSGRLGPKLAHGDRQAPEGFYTVGSDQMNPNSRWHRSFNVGFPNAFDRALGRTGADLMVHGGCSSAGCYAMTNPVVDELWRLTSAALTTSGKDAATPSSGKDATGGKNRFQVQIYPFRMSEETLAAHARSPHFAFWTQLKQGFDLFEKTGLPPVVTSCRGSYQFAPGASTASPAPIEARCTPSRLSDGAGIKKAL